MAVCLLTYHVKPICLESLCFCNDTFNYSDIHVNSVVGHDTRSTFSWEIFLSVSVSSVVSCQVCLSSPSSQGRSRGAAPAATGRSATASCCRRWTGTGTRTAWSVPAATAAWEGWAPLSTPGPTSSSAAGTTWGNSLTGVSGLNWIRERKREGN